jgi:hypothetical protein
VSIFLMIGFYATFLRGRGNAESENGKCEFLGRFVRVWLSSPLTSWVSQPMAGNHPISHQLYDSTPTPAIQYKYCKVPAVPLVTVWRESHLICNLCSTSKLLAYTYRAGGNARPVDRHVRSIHHRSTDTSVSLHGWRESHGRCMDPV